MSSLLLLIPIALVFVAIAIKVLLWALRSGQYDNLDTEAHRILFDDEQDRPDPAARARDHDHNHDHNHNHRESGSDR